MPLPVVQHVKMTIPQPESQPDTVIDMETGITATKLLLLSDIQITQIYIKKRSLKLFIILKYFFYIA